MTPPCKKEERMNTDHALRKITVAKMHARVGVAASTWQDHFVGAVDGRLFVINFTTASMWR
jgi:hypothetical protein